MQYRKDPGGGTRSSPDSTRHRPTKAWGNQRLAVFGQTPRAAITIDLDSREPRIQKMSDPDYLI